MLLAAPVSAGAGFTGLAGSADLGAFAVDTVVMAIAVGKSLRAVVAAGLLAAAAVAAPSAAVDVAAVTGAFAARIAGASSPAPGTLAAALTAEAPAPFVADGAVGGR